MVAYNQNLLQDAFHHLDNLKLKLTKLKLAYNRDRIIVSCIDDLLKDCELIQFIIESYDNHNFRHLCNIINNSFLNPNTHGVHAIITRKRFEHNADRGKFDLLNFTV
jgi:hypothetical protein